MIKGIDQGVELLVYLGIPYEIKAIEAYEVVEFRRRCRIPEGIQGLTWAVFPDYKTKHGPAVLIFDELENYAGTYYPTKDMFVPAVRRARFADLDIRL